MDGVGSAAVNGGLWGSAAEDWAAIQEQTCAPVYRAVLQRSAPVAPFDYLDVGCGAGMAACIAHEAGARVYGLDASAELLAIARRRLPDADLHVGEMEALPFADASFDLVTGFNAFQYAAHPTAALAEAKRVARPGATVVVMTWGEPQGMPAAAVVSALRPLLPAPPPGTPGPFALSDEGALRAFAMEAGLTPTEVFDVDSPWHYPDLDTALRGLRSSGVAARAIAAAGLDAVNAAHRAALLPSVQNDGSITVGASFRCLAANA